MSEANDSEAQALPTMKWWLQWWEDGEQCWQGIMCQDFEAVELYASEFFGDDPVQWSAAPATTH